MPGVNQTSAEGRSNVKHRVFSLVPIIVTKGCAMPFRGELPQPTGAEAELARNSATVFQMLTGHWVAQTVRAAADLRVTDHVAAGARTAEEVARLSASDPLTTHRLMRACASLGLLSYAGQGRYAPTPLGEVLRADVPGSLREAALVQGAYGHWQSWGRLPQAVRQGTNQVETALGMDLFQYFAKNPEEAALFAKAMSNMTGLVIEDTVRLLDLGDASLVVDIGGANGALVLALMRAHSEIQGQVFRPSARGGRGAAGCRRGGTHRPLLHGRR
jgi:hypothetical protein